MQLPAKKAFALTAAASFIVFVILTLLMHIIHFIPSYAYPAAMLSDFSLKNLIHSIIYYGILVCISLFAGWAAGSHRWRIWAEALRRSLLKKMQAFREQPLHWGLGLGMFVPALLFGYLAEFVYGRWIVGKPNSLGTYFSGYRFAFFSVLLLVILLLVHFRKTMTAKPEKAFLLISLSSTLLLASVLQPTAVISWDDQIHYTRALERSHPASIETTKADQDILEYTHPFSFDMKENAALKKTIDQDYQDGPVKTKPTHYARLYTYLAYIPSGIFLFAARALNLPFHMAFVFGRFANAFVYSILMYFAIKKLKSGKLILMTIGLFPTCIFMASNYNYDSWVIGFTALGFSYLFANMQTPEEPLAFRDAAVMILSFVVGLSAKAVYFPMMLLLLFLPEEKFKSKKQQNRFRIVLIGAMLLVAASFLLPMLIQGPVTDVRGGSDVNGTSQLAYLFTHPLAYTQTLLMFLKDYLSLENSEMYTQFWAFYGTSGYQVLSMLLLGSAVFLDQTGLHRHTSKRRFRLSVVLLCFLTICLVATAFYIAFTPVGQNTIAGCQPRYILPLLFPLLYIAGGAFQRNYFTKPFHHYVLYGLLIYTSFASIWNLSVSKFF